MSEIAILHRCPHCGRVFDSPSFCVEGDVPTEPFPQKVPSQMFRKMNENTAGETP